MNKASKVKFVLGIVAMTSLAAINPAAANATTLESSLAVQNIMSQAKLNLDSPTQQSEILPSLEKLQASSELAARPKRPTNGGCTFNNSCRKRN
ncbi:hypothetical protein [Iningainema tapete]|uniref:Uncharacterized protein n=1 Tax=Iningainema tapete BLCC-T55 TaxID=2748662 RepID=A0A8J6XZ37_9CYAN|nr:hypothetical protein [Iningainema tapete]MBD2775798.1 hypothetical protein [Iningainema tapete BLCC-T55]